MVVVSDNLLNINQEIKQACERVGRQQEEINIVAVTKYVSNERAEEAVASGVKHLGESRAEGLLEKREAITGAATWHFIGQLQSRKVKDVIHECDYLHSLDRISLAKEIQKRYKGDGTVKCFVQVNVSGEESKSGLTPEGVMSFIEQLQAYDAIEVVGLMTMAPYESVPEDTRPHFKKLKELQQEIVKREFAHAPCHELSMGMSNDYTVAIEEGATFIRVGSRLVGDERSNLA
ncbi:YggS family pyridoxal phosphate-dependent enzyme [Geomicrobium sediminis]|uniref:Pyridoxal phosphate homeostasis protein n=1 Tax=Geomicrobium sediminis TaxID=1347788 RepID=A0ABS2PB02_9BACL|nr:YggS family pyridoxal phosphate-dependent enzyme [Geomicrobium sediminis]MBM7632507.1 pyridoxal phosphate enzyme (YggS family) [Geomicrobium sediminis]